jgi:hypothetical protein
VASALLPDRAMPPKTDMMTLARLHAALDSVVETEQLLAEVRETTPGWPNALARASAAVVEARELLRALLRSDPRHRVEIPSSL